VCLGGKKLLLILCSFCKFQQMVRGISVLILNISSGRLYPNIVFFGRKIFDRLKFTDPLALLPAISDF